MTIGQSSEVIQHLRRTALLHDGAGLSDGQLLEHYISGRDDAALSAIVRRHGPMVWGVCRRVLGNHHDAEDAFQATFLVLVRKAASIASRELLANWLYGVAYQTARKAKTMNAKRNRREKQLTKMPEPAVAEPDQEPDLQLLLDQELSRLPDKYRAVIVLCDLEGKTRKEAACQLGCPEGTVAGRLARARTMLAKRLAQRGLALSGAALAAALAENAASASVPVSVVSCTIKAATAVAAGQTAAAEVVSVKVAALTEGVMKTMLMTKLRIVMMLFVFTSLVSVAGLIYQTQAAGSKGDKRNQPAKNENEPSPDKQPGAGNDNKPGPVKQRPHKAKLRTLLKKRLEILKRNADRMKDLYALKAIDRDLVRKANVRVYKAELDLCETPMARIVILEKIVKLYKEKEDRITQLAKRNAVGQQERDDAALDRLEAEIALEREKMKLAEGGRK